MNNTILRILILFLSLQSFSQTLRGRIVDEFNQPIENVYIININSNSHTHSNENGLFILQNAKINSSIKVSVLGFENQTIKINNVHLNKGIKIVLNTKIFLLEELVLRKELNSLKTISKIDLKVNPVNNSQEILRKVPGLFIGQHAGGGKAEQIFLRGFDIDHGTDITLSVDGLPINMVSHAHGQGYSDLHFIIPETIQKIDFGKGPYYANQGDFNTAGYVNFSTKNAISKNTIAVEYGDFNTLKTLALFNLLEQKKDENAYVAIELIEFDGPYKSPQNFNRLNIFGKYSTFLKGKDRLTLTTSHFKSSWEASGQIPQRAVDNGSITRFGAIDDTEGGFTSRTNVNLELFKTLSEESLLKTNVFYSNYNFELYSNFTFFLNDAINGDQIKQFENRNILGLNTQFITNKQHNNIEAKYTTGLGFRYDMVFNNELSHTKNRREVLQKIQLGNVKQNNMFAYLNAEFESGKFKISPSIRLDYFKFLYENQLSLTYELLSKTKAIVNPKLNILYSQNDNLQWFLKSGIGFHSNDTRVVLQQNADKVLPRAYGVDFGNIWKPTEKLILNTALWYLFSEEEFVYVGDAGIVEPSGKSERYGIDLGLRYQIADWLFFDSDATFTKAKSLEDIKGQDFIPLAPKVTITGGLSFTNLNKFSGAFRYRYLGDRPANEDNSIIAKGYLVTDFNLNYNFNKNINIGISLENLFDVDWNETQFATESRLQHESNSVEEIHFTPGTPFFAKATFKYSF